jgi:hypothetical protein
MFCYGRRRPANLEMIYVEDPEPENELKGTLLPSPDVMLTNALVSLECHT